MIGKMGMSDAKVILCVWEEEGVGVMEMEWGWKGTNSLDQK
jgi:hypothetical protein